ncbi:hypothetical protein CCS38_18310 [Streptomyces purpurogeneiscleroticus]|nr:hypothetical protein [Streptomyces purpurogeneiscleroticus]
MICGRKSGLDCLSDKACNPAKTDFGQARCGSGDGGTGPVLFEHGHSPQEMSAWKPARSITQPSLPASCTGEVALFQADGQGEGKAMSYGEGRTGRGSRPGGAPGAGPVAHVITVGQW